MKSIQYLIIIALSLTLAQCAKRKQVTVGAQTNQDKTNVVDVDGDQDTDGTPGRVSTEDLTGVDDIQADEIKVVSYNLLNLFDTEHDVGKKDHTFLPMGTPGKQEACKKVRGFYGKLCRETDWTEKHLELKLQQIKKVVDSMGSLPDLLGVQEIENAAVSKELANVLGYKSFVVTDSPDRRGIDVALFFRTNKLTYIDHEEIILDGPEFKSKPTRNILRVHFKFRDQKHAGKVLGVYVNHWPSQAAPASKRYATAKYKQEAIDKYTKEIGADKYFVVSIGDYNTLSQESPNAFHNVISDPGWANALTDLRQYSFRQKNPKRKKMAPMSYYYAGRASWQALDRIFISKNLMDGSGIEVIENSFRVISHDWMSRTFQFTRKGEYHFGTKIEGVPLRYNFGTLDAKKAGYSDHFPVMAKFKF